MRTKRAILNYLTDLIPMIILMFIGLIKIDFFIDLLGSEKNGLYNTYSQIIAYLTLVDGGLTSAVLYRLYKPIAEHDEKRLNSILSGSKKIFNIIGIMIFILGIIISFFIPVFLKDESFEFSYLQMTFLLYLIGSVIPYFCIVSKTVLEAYQEKYIANIVTQVVAIIKGILEIVVLFLGFDLYTIILIYTLSNLISSVIIYVVCKKRYPGITLKSENPSFEILTDVKNLMIHKIGSLVANNVDVIIISSMLGLVYVTIYTSYNYIISNLTSVIGKISYSIIAGVGDLLALDKEKAYGFFNEFNTMSFFIASIVCVPVLIVVNPFINLWLGGKIEVSFVLALAFVLNLFYYIIRMPLQTYVTSAGLYRETRHLPIIEIVVNLSLSIFLIRYIGVAGVLYATFIAYLVSDYFIKPRIIYQKLFTDSYWSYYRKNTFFFVVIGVGYIFTNLFARFLCVYMTSYFYWFLISALLFIINFIIVIGAYYISGNLMFMDRFTKYLKR